MIKSLKEIVFVLLIFFLNTIPTKYWMCTMALSGIQGLSLSCWNCGSNRQQNTLSSDSSSLGPGRIPGKILPCFLSQALLFKSRLHTYTAGAVLPWSIDFLLMLYIFIIKQIEIHYGKHKILHISYTKHESSLGVDCQDFNVPCSAIKTIHCNM